MVISSGHSVSPKLCTSGFYSTSLNLLFPLTLLPRTCSVVTPADSPSPLHRSGLFPFLPLRPSLSLRNDHARENACFFTCSAGLRLAATVLTTKKTHCQVVPPSLTPHPSHRSQIPQPAQPDPMSQPSASAGRHCHPRAPLDVSSEIGCLRVTLTADNVVQLSSKGSVSTTSSQSRSLVY